MAIQYVFNGAGEYVYGWDDETRTIYNLSPSGEVLDTRPYTDQENWEADMRAAPPEDPQAAIRRQVSELAAQYTANGGDLQDLRDLLV